MPREQLRVLPEDPLVEGPQLVARRHAELLVEQATHLPIGLEGLGLSPRAVEREHALGLEALPQRVLTDEPAELRLELVVSPAEELGVDPRRGRGEPQF